MNSGEYILRRLNVKAIGMLISFLLVATGAVMIFLGIHDEGFIDVKTPFINGQAKSGFVGVLLIVCAVVIVTSALFTKKSTHEFTLKRGDAEIQWKGTCSTAEELHLVTTTMHQQLRDLASFSKAEQMQDVSK